MIFDSQEQKNTVLRMFTSSNWSGAEIDKAAAFKRSIQVGLVLSLDQQKELVRTMDQPEEQPVEDQPMIEEETKELQCQE